MLKSTLNSKFIQHSAFEIQHLPRRHGGEGLLDVVEHGKRRADAGFEIALAGDAHLHLHERRLPVPDDVRFSSPTTKNSERTG